ncbi:hypothetical protein TELCIR_11243 [Teladorsagia circumcincta]|uniref:Uncharacterized protein n=1 Tax=Teladorsagia circumcincta TaxID=45464 RepID=A0A2G9UB98_TELCI|nr:hypothetical protein TELCIR_11243 [Teladorsagia circumcincta]
MNFLFSFDFSESDTEVTAIGQNEQVSDMFPASRSRKNKERRAERKMRRFLDLENSVVNSKSAGARKQRQSENGSSFLYVIYYFSVFNSYSTFYEDCLFLLIFRRTIFLSGFN